MKQLLSYRRSELWLSSLKLARIAALSFCTTARSSAIVFEARTLRMNCFTVTHLHQHLLTLSQRPAALFNKFLQELILTGPRYSTLCFSY